MRRSEAAIIALFVHPDRGVVMTPRLIDQFGRANEVCVLHRAERARFGCQHKTMLSSGARRLSLLISSFLFRDRAPPLEPPPGAAVNSAAPDLKIWRAA